MAKVVRYIIVAVGTAFNVLFAAVFGIFFKPKTLPYKRYMIYTLKRSMSYFDPRRELDSSLSTSDVYRKFMESKGRPLEIVKLPRDCVGLWLGPAHAEKVLLYCYGGAYVSAANPGDFRMLQDVMDTALSHGKPFKTFFLQYELVPTGVYPRQLEQAIAALDYLLGTLKILPSNIFIGGDSAGGHLVLSLISHLLHPHPELSPLSLQDAHLAGAFLLSPWVTFDQHAHSMRTNATRDYEDKRNLATCARRWLSHSKQDHYTSPLEAPTEWWDAVPAKEIAVSVGSFEIMQSDIMEIAEKLKVHNPQTTLLIGEVEVHCQPVINHVVGWPKARGQEMLEEWILGVLG